MAKVVNCRDLGFDCAGVVRAETEAKVLKLVAEYAKAAHNMDKVSQEVDDKVLEVMYEE